MSLTIYTGGGKHVDWDKIYPNFGYLDNKNNKTVGMDNTMDEYMNAGGYGIFCGKKCIAKKQAQGIAPKRGKKHIASWNAQQAQAAAAAAAAQTANKSGSKSKTGMIIGIGVLVVALGIVVVVRSRKKS